MLTVALRASFSFCTPAGLPALPLVSRQSFGRGRMNGYRLLSGPQKDRFARTGYSLLWFDSGAGYTLSSLALVQAVACLSEGSSILSGERKERELLGGKAVAGYVG